MPEGRHSGAINYGNNNEHITKKSHKIDEEKDNKENSLEFRISGEAQDYELSHYAVVHPPLAIK